MRNIYVSNIESNIGKIFIASSDKGLIKVSLDCSKEDFIKSLISSYNRNIVFNDRKNEKILTQMKNYLKGNLKKFDVGIDIKVTDFQKKILNMVKRIEYGKVKSYGQIAKEIKKPGASRAVGNAIAKNPIPIVIPCHRVVKSDGTIGGFGGKVNRVDIKRKLLKIEGLKIS